MYHYWAILLSYKTNQYWDQNSFVTQNCSIAPHTIRGKSKGIGMNRWRCWSCELMIACSTFGGGMGMAAVIAGISRRCWIVMAGFISLVAGFSSKDAMGQSRPSSYRILSTIFCTLFIFLVSPLRWTTLP